MKHWAAAGCRGSFLADPETAGLLRLEILVDEAPPPAGMKFPRDSTEYGRVRLGGSDFLLPGSVETVLVPPSGAARRNEIRFDRCRRIAR